VAAPEPPPEGATYRVPVPGWHPATMTELIQRGVRARVRAKKRDRKVIADYLVLAARVPAAAGRRRVTLELVYPPGRTRRDEDGCWKSLLDALVWNGLLVDDGPAWVECLPVAYSEGPGRAAVITLEDPPSGGS
jgi:hypothetical protein